MVQKILGKSGISKKTQKNTCGYGAPVYRRTIEQRAAASTRARKMKTKQNKTNVTPEKDAMASANQTPRGYKFAPLVARQQGRANQHEPACFGLSSPWPFPSRSGIPLHAVVSPALTSSATIHFPMKCSAPCSAVLRHSPLVLGCSRSLIGVDAESFEVVQETPHLLLFLAPHTACAPHQFSVHHALRQSRILHARHKSRKQDSPSA